MGLCLGFLTAFLSIISERAGPNARVAKAMHQQRATVLSLGSTPTVSDNEHDTQVCQTC